MKLIHNAPIEFNQFTNLEGHAGFSAEPEVPGSVVVTATEMIDSPDGVKYMVRDVKVLYVHPSAPSFPGGAKLQAAGAGTYQIVVRG